MSEQTPKHSVSVAGIVVNDRDEVLVIKRRDNGKWEMPGGVLELEETFEEGVIREVHEETGMTVTVERLTGVYKNMNRAIVALVFRCAVIEGIPQKTSESRDVRWMTQTEIGKTMDEAFAVRVFDAFATDAASRSHDGACTLDCETSKSNLESTSG